MDDRRRSPAETLSLVTPTLVRRRYATEWHVEGSESPPSTELHLVLAGHGRFHRAGSAAVPLAAGDIVLRQRDASEDTQHAHEPSLETLSASYDAVALAALGADPNGPLHLAADRVTGKPDLGSIVSFIRNEIERRDPSADLLRRLFDVLLLCALREGRSSASRRKSHALADLRIQKVLSALRTDLGERWSIATMAKLAGMSRAAFVRRFKETTGAAPLAYLTRLRLDRARDRLIESDDQVAEIAQMCGYDSVYAFSRAFKRAIGVAPRVYRRQARGAFTPSATVTMRRAA